MHVSTFRWKLGLCLCMWRAWPCLSIWAVTRLTIFCWRFSQLKHINIWVCWLYSQIFSLLMLEIFLHFETLKAHFLWIFLFSLFVRWVLLNRSRNLLKWPLLRIFVHFLHMILKFLNLFDNEILYNTRSLIKHQN